MANWPSMTQHNALADRVSGLESNPGGGDSGGQGALYAGIPALAYPGVSNDVASIARIVVSWKRRSVHVVGFRLVGDIPLEALSGVGLTRGGNQSSEEFSWYPGHPYTSLTRRVVEMNNVTYTEFYLSEQPVKTDAYLIVAFADNRDYRVRSEPVGSMTGVQVKQSTFDDTPVPGCAYIDVLSSKTFEVPVVPEPSYPVYGEGSDSTRHVEVVWEATGAPYLHVYQAQDADGMDAHYHLPLVEGLPAPESPESGGAV